MVELNDAASEALEALRQERAKPVADRITGAHDQDVDDWISWVQKLLAAGIAGQPPSEAWISGSFNVAIANWPAGSPLRVSTERFLAGYSAVEKLREESAAADYRRNYGIFRGHYAQENRAGVSATYETVWGLLSFFESSANVDRAIQEGAKWSKWAVEDYSHWASNLPRMPKAPRRPVDVASEEAKTRAANRVSACVRHAHAYFDAAQRSPNTVRPNLLYYGCLALGKALIWASFEDAPEFHGLRSSATTVRVLSGGEFAAFHDVVCTVPSMYAGGGEAREFELDMLLANVEPLREALVRTRGEHWRLAGRAWMLTPDRFDRAVVDKAGDMVPTHSLAIDLAGLFFLSNWSRYQPVEWEQVLRGEKSGDVHIYLTFLDHIALDFPLQIANLLMGVRNVFTPRETDQEFAKRVMKVLGDKLAF